MTHDGGSCILKVCAQTLMAALSPSSHEESNLLVSVWSLSSRHDWLGSCYHQHLSLPTYEDLDACAQICILYPCIDAMHMQHTQTDASMCPHNTLITHIDPRPHMNIGAQCMYMQHTEEIHPHVAIHAYIWTLIHRDTDA